MFSCESCHVRSGMGSTEGTVITYPTCGSWLYKPLQGAEMKAESQARVPSRLDPPPFRPAYTDESLARVIRRGKDPNDRVLDYVMPRYLVGGTDLDILVYYLKNLSSQWSPGVDDTTIRFATVIGPDVAEVDRQGDARRPRGPRPRPQQPDPARRAKGRGGPFYKEEKNAPYRRYALSVWELEGAAETWPEQLRGLLPRRSRSLPSSVASPPASWAPIHEFCERNADPVSVSDHRLPGDFGLRLVHPVLFEGLLSRRVRPRRASCAGRRRDPEPSRPWSRSTATSPRPGDLARGFSRGPGVNGHCRPPTMLTRIRGPDDRSRVLEEAWRRPMPGAVLAAVARRRRT